MIYPEDNNKWFFSYNIIILYIFLIIYDINKIEGSAAIFSKFFNHNTIQQIFKFIFKIKLILLNSN